MLHLLQGRGRIQQTLDFLHHTLTVPVLVEDQARAACEIADRRRRKLERRTVRLGSRLYAERPGAYVDRIGAYWAAWHEVGDEKAAGGIADLYPADDGLDELDLTALRDRAGEAGLPGSLAPTREDLIGDLRANAAR